MLFSISRSNTKSQIDATLELGEVASAEIEELGDQIEEHDVDSIDDLHEHVVHLLKLQEKGRKKSERLEESNRRFASIVIPIFIVIFIVLGFHLVDMKIRNYN